MTPSPKHDVNKYSFIKARVSHGLTCSKRRCSKLKNSIKEIVHHKKVVVETLFRSWPWASLHSCDSYTPSKLLQEPMWWDKGLFPSVNKWTTLLGDKSMEMQEINAMMYSLHHFGNVKKFKFFVIMRGQTKIMLVHYQLRWI